MKFGKPVGGRLVYVYRSNWNWSTLFAQATPTIFPEIRELFPGNTKAIEGAHTFCQVMAGAEGLMMQAITGWGGAPQIWLMGLDLGCENLVF